MVLRFPNKMTKLNLIASNLEKCCEKLSAEN